MANGEFENLDERYADIELANERAIRQVASRGFMELSATEIQDMYEAADPRLLQLKPSWLALSVQPDLRGDLHERGEETMYGDPTVIYGDIPDRTRQMMDSLFELANAEHLGKTETTTGQSDLHVGVIEGKMFYLRERQQVYRIGDELQGTYSVQVLSGDPENIGVLSRDELALVTEFLVNTE